MNKAGFFCNVKDMKNGFTLIEVIVVSTILIVLSAVGISSYTGTIKRTRDARRKADLNTIQKALESYYDDNGSYPATATADTLCATSDKCYLRAVPADPLTGTADYTYVLGDVGGTGQSFQLYSTLETDDDYGPGAGRYAPSCGSSVCRYGVSSTNTNP